MSIGHGGLRMGAGRKKTSARKRRQPINSKGAKLKSAEIKGGYCPEPHEYINMTTKNASENIAKIIYNEIYEWLKSHNCEHLVQPHLIEQYALSYARYSQAETALHQFGMLAKGTNGNPVPSPYIEISQTYLKQSQYIWLAIYSVIKDTCNDCLHTESESAMSKLVNRKA